MKAPLLIQIEIADWPSGIRRFFGFAQSFLKFLFEQIGRVLLRFDGLAENGVAPVVLLFHGAGGFLHVIKHFGLDRGDMGYHSFDLGVHFKHRAAARASQIEGLLLLGRRHLEKSYSKTS